MFLSKQVAGSRTVAPLAARAAAVLLAAAGCLAALPARAEIQVFYQAQDLANVDPEQDLWRYTYSVTGRPFPQFHGFNLFFPAISFGPIVSVEQPASGWAPVDAVSPDVSLDLPGVLSARASTDLTAQTWLFAVDVVWRDPYSRPGSQRYELFDADLNTIDPPGVLGTLLVPEPHPGVLMLAGLAFLAAVRSRRGT